MTRGYVAVWRRAVKDAKWGAYERVFRATALELAECSRPDGTICRRRDDLAKRVGLVPRTFDYHLAHLIDRGWIERLPIANRNEPRTYRLVIPPVDHSQHLANETAPTIRNPQRMKTPRPFANSCESHIDKANVSEHLALKEDAADETTTTAMATATQPGAKLSRSHNEEHPEHQHPSAACVAPRARPGGNDAREVFHLSLLQFRLASGTPADYLSAGRPLTCASGGSGHKVVT